jgi:hypothetical protein
MRDKMIYERMYLSWMTPMIMRRKNRKPELVVSIWGTK